MFFVYAQKGESVNLVVVVLLQKIYLCVWLVSLLSIFSFIDHDRHLMLILPGLLFLYVVFFNTQKKVSCVIMYGVLYLSCIIIFLYKSQNKDKEHSSLAFMMLMLSFRLCFYFLKTWTKKKVICINVWGRICLNNTNMKGNTLHPLIRVLPSFFGLKTV